MKIKVATFNLRMNNRADGINYFFNRSPYILNKINLEKPDIIGFQEATEAIYEWLKVNLTDYNFVGIGRSDKFLDEANPIAFRKDKFELFGFEQFWLSLTPEVPGSRYAEQSSCPRICCSAKLLDKADKKIVRFYNTHLDHIGEEARLLGIGQILELIKKDYESVPYPVVLTGDMNAYPSEISMKKICELDSPHLFDITESAKRTFHGFNGGDWSLGGEKIDYIFTNLSTEKPTLSVWDECHDGIYLSDHYPLSAELNI